MQLQTNPVMNNQNILWLNDEASLKWAQSQLPFTPVFFFISQDFKGEEMGLSYCIFIFSKQHICNYLLPSPIRYDNEMSLGCCFLPSSIRQGGNLTYLGNITEKWRRCQCCTCPWAATESCVCSQGLKSKESFLFLYPSYTREGGRCSSAIAWWRKVSEDSTQERWRGLWVTSGTGVDPVIWCSDLNIWGSKEGREV